MKYSNPILMVIALLCISGCGASSTRAKISTPTSNVWTWVGGAEVVNQMGTYGAQGSAAATNFPGARQQSVRWTDTSANFWLFGGSGYDATGTPGNLNDLWEYSSSQWTWMGGSNAANQTGMYGTLGTAAAGNVPGARNSGVGWIDKSGNFWLFGGSGNDSTGTQGDLNDLWKYSAGQWTWVGGANVANQTGTYGTLATPATGNIPGGRFHSVSWTDASGNLWLFGGNGYDSTGTPGYLNDLWEYSAGQWTWMGGASVVSQTGTYGTLGAAAASNVPGARQKAVSWTDASGNFWLLGGYGYDSVGTLGYLNDLWKYSAGQWTWIGGSNKVNQTGTYGTLGTAAPGNVPGARSSGVGWIDASGNFWIFGGNGYDSAGTQGYLDDLWKYSAGQWTWVSGSSLANESGIYGTQGTAASDNVAGGRFHGVSWIDASGNFWLFGGNGYDSTATPGSLNDLWKYEP